MTEKYVLENGVIKNTTNNITFRDFVDILILINGQSRHLTELSKENEQLKQFKSKVFNLLQDEIREESELLDYYLKEKAPCNADRQQIIIGVLKRLQKELE